MDKILANINKWAMVALMLAGVVFTVLVFTTETPDAAEVLNSGAQNTESVVDLQKAAEAQALDAPVGNILTYAYIMLILGIVAVLFGIGRDVAINPKGIGKKIIILAGLAAVVVIAYVLAPGDPLLEYNGETLPTPGELKLTDTVLYLTYITVAAAIAAILFGGIYGKIKK